MRTTSYITRASLWIFYGLLAYMPLHIFLSTWLGTSWGILEVTRIAKDVVLVLGFCLVLVPSLRTTWFKGILRDKLTWLIVAYALLTILMALVKPTDQDAEVLGVVYNLRFLMFFLYARLLVGWYQPQHVVRRSVQLVLAAGAAVVAFGLLQYFVLSSTALSHVGYTRQNGVLPVFLIDDKPDLERIMSTLRDPNSLGSYLIIIASLAAVVWLRVADRTKKRLTAALFGLTLLCLWLTFSRSALIGLVAALVVLAALSSQKTGPLLSKYRAHLVIGGICLVVVMSAGLFVLRDSYLVQNVILHADQSTVLEDPNQLRIRYFKESIGKVVTNPIGSGPGTAGLASIRNNIQGTILNEDYYLQIATEVGLFGLALFVAILALTGWRLWQHRQNNWLAMALLASFAGLAITNILVHIWANEAVAYTWWGLAGLALVAAKRKPATKST